jgi:hypothetical protein
VNKTQLYLEGICGLELPNISIIASDTALFLVFSDFVCS